MGWDSAAGVTASKSTKRWPTTFTENASFVHHAAMRDALLPRKPMPKPGAFRGPSRNLKAGTLPGAPSLFSPGSTG